MCNGEFREEGDVLVTLQLESKADRYLTTEVTASLPGKLYLRYMLQRTKEVIGAQTVSDESRQICNIF